MRYLICAAMALGLATSAAAVAADTTVVVTPGSSWTNDAGENRGGGSSAITDTVARSGNGSLEMFGDRTRYQTGIFYGGATNLAPLSSVTGLAFDWRVAADSSGAYNVDQTPALRLHVQDGDQRSELVWEGVYNGTYGNTARDTWYSTSFGDNFYQWVNGSGNTFVNGQQVNKTIAQWIAENYSSNAYVSAISVGVGSGFSSNYHAFADNVRFGQTSGVTTFNFEVAAAAVPEPATWAMMIAGFGLVGGMARSRRRTASVA